MGDDAGLPGVSGEPGCQLCRLLGGRRAHLPGHQLVDPVDRMTLGDLCQGIVEIGFRVDAVELCRLNEGVYGCRANTAGIRTGEEKILSPQGNRGAILPISAKKWRSITAGTRCMAARSGSSTPSSDLEERLSSLRLNRVWRSCLPPGCLILPFARRCRLALRRSTLLA